MQCSAHGAVKYSVRSELYGGLEADLDTTLLLARMARDGQRVGTGQ
jgi:hypothetical protein